MALEVIFAEECEECEVIEVNVGSGVRVAKEM